MNDPRVYALVFGALSGAATFLVAFGSQRVAGIDLETAFWIALGVALTPYAVRQSEGFKDALKEANAPEVYTREETNDALEVALSRWSKQQAIPLTGEEKDAIMAETSAVLDFSDDYHFSVDGKGRHLGQSVGCKRCSESVIGQGA